MAKLGSKKRPLILRVRSDEAARKALAICAEHEWHYILGMEPDKPEDLRDLDRALGRAGDEDRSGVMVPFAEFFPDLALEETRSAMIIGAPAARDTELP